MDVLLLPWTFATFQCAAALVLAMVAQMTLTLRLYFVAGTARMKAGREKRVTADTYAVVGDEPADLAILTRALANQFELPILFHVVVLAHLALGTASWFTVVLAIAFVVLRVLHANEMTGGNRVMLRRKLFLRGVTVFAVMLAELALAAIFVAIP